jgi:rhodanese-related sulfurtransferase
MSLVRKYTRGTSGGGGEHAFEAVLTPEALEEMIALEPRTRILDVRTPGEYESVHIRGAYNVPLDELADYATEIRSNVSDPVVLVCQSGARARKVEEALLRCSMTNLHVLDGGVNAWVGSGRSATRGRKRLSLERQVRIAAGALAAAGGAFAVALNPLFAVVPTLVGSGLVFAGVTDRCGMAMMLARLPYNRPVSCDVDAMVRALATGAQPQGLTRSAEAPAARSCQAA